MIKVPDAFGARIGEHNRSCWIAAALSLLCAALAWTAAGVLYLSGVLLFEVRASETPELPRWFYPVAFCGVAGSCIAARKIGIIACEAIKSESSTHS